MKTADLKIGLDDDEIAKIKTLIRELHEVIQEAQDVRAGLAYDLAVIKDKVDEVVAGHVERNLETLGVATKQAILKTEAAVNKRFDTIVSILLGEDPQSRRQGKPTLAKYAERVRERLEHVEEEIAAEREAEEESR